MARQEAFNREEVIGKAKEVFWSKGYNGTSMQDLVDAMDLNRSSIYNSFGSKMDLYRLALDQYRSESGQLFDEIEEKPKNGLEKIGLIFLYSLESIHKDSEDKGCMLINCSTEMGNQCNDLNGFLESNYQNVVKRFEELVVKGQQDGSIRSDEDPGSLANYITSTFHGFRITGLHTKDQKALKGIIQNVLKTIA